MRSVSHVPQLGDWAPLASASAHSPAATWIPATVLNDCILGRRHAAALLAQSAAALAQSERVVDESAPIGSPLRADSCSSGASASLESAVSPNSPAGVGAACEGEEQSQGAIPRSMPPAAEAVASAASALLAWVKAQARHAEHSLSLVRAESTWDGDWDPQPSQTSRQRERNRISEGEHSHPRQSQNPLKILSDLS